MENNKEFNEKVNAETTQRVENENKKGAFRTFFEKNCGKILIGTVTVMGLWGLNKAGKAYRNGYAKGYVQGAGNQATAERCAKGQEDNLTKETGINIRGHKRFGDSVQQGWTDRGFGRRFK